MKMTAAFNGVAIAVSIGLAGWPIHQEGGSPFPNKTVDGVTDGCDNRPMPPHVTLNFPDGSAVLEHGFRFRPVWWTARLPHADWGGFLNSLPAIDRGYHCIARADVLKAGNCHGQEPPLLPRALVAGYVWGTGSSAFLVGRRARVFRDNPPDRIAEALTSAVDVLRELGPVDAYESFLHGKPNNLKHLGPSFFTKFLYAADASGDNPGRALILDRFVVAALNEIDSWGIPRNGPWDSGTYNRWLDHAHSLAATHTHQSGRLVRVDAVEMAYFQYGRSLG